MCLGIPGKILSVESKALRMGKIAFGPIKKEVCLEYVPEADVGDYVLVHAGFAIGRIDEREAQRVHEYLVQIAEIEEAKTGERRTRSTGDEGDEISR